MDHFGHIDAVGGTSMSTLSMYRDVVALESEALIADATCRYEDVIIAHGGRAFQPAGAGPRS
jgi:hypothetical protein